MPESPTLRAHLRIHQWHWGARLRRARAFAEVEVSRDGAFRVRRVFCAVDCGTVVNPDIVRAQIQGAIIFSVTAALYGEITLKDGRVEQTNFDTYQILRMNEAPAIEVHVSRFVPKKPDIEFDT